ncbi:MAG: 2-phospho-L-lactate transferase [Pseudomonadota bacterium]
MKILAITGGVGGAKLAVGLADQLGPEQLLFAVNTGDDFEHLGLNISPDIDSLTYALAHQNNDELGWGRAGETWQFIDTLGALGGEDWFRLGDKDLALHVRRTQMLNQGMTLTAATAAITSAMGIAHTVAPMTDDPVRTIVHSDVGDLAFQHYFVRERCKPAVNGFSFDGLPSANLNPVIASWLEDCDGIIICPSNPYVSVDPLLHLPGMREAMGNIPVVAISPIVGGIAIKGPAAKMMAELNVPASTIAVAEHYGDLLSAFIIDKTDENDIAVLQDQMQITTIVTNTIMLSFDDRVALAADTIKVLSDLTRQA